MYFTYVIAKNLSNTPCDGAAKLNWKMDNLLLLEVKYCNKNMYLTNHC